MRLTEEMIQEDDTRFKMHNLRAEFYYCGKEVPKRKSITNDNIRFYAWLCRSAYALLKEQEPKQIVRKQGKRENSDGSIDFFGEWYCPHCGKLLNRGFDLPWIEFCYKCGKPILWEGR